VGSHCVVHGEVPQPAESFAEQNCTWEIL